MGNLFTLFQSGIIAIVTLPYYLLILAYYIVKGTISYVLFFFKMIFCFFTGRNIFKNKHDRVVDYLNKDEHKEEDERVAEAYKNVGR